MPNRFQVKQHEIAYKFIAARDGEYCLICKGDGKLKKSVETKLQIDHADNNTKNWGPANLHLVCQKHNLWLRQMTAQAHRKTIYAYSAKNEREREKKLGVETTHAIKELVDYRSGSTEMQANSYYETYFREWLLGELLRLGSMPKKEAINSGAEVVGCSQVTTRRYIEKLTSAVGNLKERKDGSGVVIVTFRVGKG